MEAAAGGRAPRQIRRGGGDAARIRISDERRQLPLAKGEQAARRRYPQRRVGRPIHRPYRRAAQPVEGGGSLRTTSVKDEDARRRRPDPQAPVALGVKT